jgi:hypothetical protein
MPSIFPPKKNSAMRIVFPILDNTGAPVPNATGLDSEYSLDGGSLADCTNEAVQIDTSGIYYLDLVAAETNADVFTIRVQTSTANAKTTILVFYTSSLTLDELKALVDALEKASFSI